MIIRNVAIIGAGQMGVALKYYFLSLGISVTLFDRAALAQERDRIDFKSTDWILECITENKSFKLKLLSFLSQILPPSWNGILTTNTSALSIQELSEVLPEHLKKRFFGTHFFIPPLRNRLVELISHTGTDPIIFQQMFEWLSRDGQRISLVAQDRAGFLSTRIGAFSRGLAFRLMEKYSLNFFTVDDWTGVKMGRPKTATFGTLDWVGIDLAKTNLENIYARHEQNEWRDYLLTPQWMTDLFEQRFWGRKTARKGCYWKPGHLLLEYDPASENYLPSRIQNDEFLRTQFQTEYLSSLRRYARNLEGESSEQNLSQINACLEHGHGWSLKL